MTYDLITITWNSEKTLQRTLDSVAAQKQAPHRYIFIDGGSEDNTCKIIEQFKTAHPAIDVILEQQRAKGISQAWNQALPYLQSELVALLNSDDWWLDDTMSRVLHHFNNDPSSDILSGSILYTQNENDPAPKLMRTRSLKLFPVLMPIMHPACFIKKSVYDEIGGFDEELKTSMDYDFIYRCLNAKCHFKSVNEVFTYMQAGGMANANRIRARQETRDVALKHGPLCIPRVAYLARVLRNR
ncbi:glycosyltransferase [Lentisphaera profundi]|uniref:Glycosyltransferase n=1 Tax=Lentisphaera profundi TaxID=1658616 RepID=A0ABY7VQ46_9BACT|nr:glycosyltransferase [Lentisphaera profundi]WDE95956.1 glycosyltransferase [Lentisphaera profundi]